MPARANAFVVLSAIAVFNSLRGAYFGSPAANASTLSKKNLILPTLSGAPRSKLSGVRFVWVEM
jgi:hypothetical protein